MTSSRTTIKRRGTSRVEEYDHGTRPFVDTNVFVYSVDTSTPAKRERALGLLAEIPSAVVSTQVMNEFYVAATRKLNPALSTEDAMAVVTRMSKLGCVSVDAELVLSAIEAGLRWQLSHWDALMVAAARRAGCDVILTEDLHDGADYGGVRVENPFK